MKKLYTTLLVLLLAAAAAVGFWSLVDKDATESVLENRRLASKPDFSWSALLDGSYVSQLEAYYSDTFPGREGMLKLNQHLNRFYYYGGSGDDNLLVLDYQGGAEQGGAARPTQEEPPEDPSASVTDPTPENPPEEVPEEVPDETPQDPADTPASAQPEEDPEYTSAGSVLIVGDRALEVPTATNSIIEAYAGAVGNLHAALDGVEVISLVTPNAGQFYAPKDFHSGDHDQQTMIDFCYSRMDGDVVTVDAYSALAAHTEEYIYFRTDHHWTALGAYYAYTAFCEAMDLEPVPLSDFETGVYEDFVGSMYGFTSIYPQSSVLKDNPDTLIYYKPVVETHAKYYADASLTDGLPVSVVYTKETSDNKYLCFLGGDHPAATIDCAVDGPVLLVLKDSYGNAFLPFLTSHYSRIIVIDPREFNQAGKPSLDLAAFAKEQGVDQLLVLNYPFMISNSTYVGYLNALVGAE